MNNNEENQYDNKDSYDILQGWHEKAKEQKQDPFASFVFEYLAFIFYLRKIKYTKDTKVKSDGKAISEFKKDTIISQDYLNLIKKDVKLKETWEKLIKILKDQPLRNETRENMESLKINSEEDWEHMVDFWNFIRNNLFHGEKDPEEKRDIILVSYAYETLSPLIEEILLKRY